jgi:uncharacterized integral membrane protein (TIGR00697 family)
MLSLSPESIVNALNALPPEAIWVLVLLVSFGSILVMLRYFGEAGMFAYIAIAVIGANIQVIKPVQFSVFPAPVALGTILFASTYLATDILTEFFGPDRARRAVMLGFFALLLWTVLMVLTLGYRPLTAEEAGSDYAWALGVQDAMLLLFKPAPALLVAGMTAYLVSQLNDIWIYQLVRRLTRGRHLWLRASLSTMVSALVDNTVFSVLAWVVLAPEPVGWRPLIFTYLLGTYSLRLVLALLESPFMYAARAVLGPARPAVRQGGAPA